MPYKPNKEDLAKLKDSKPVPIIAHSHEVIVPVVYSGLVNQFLEKKGIRLPLTHHELALMKHDAGVSGYAKGTTNLTVNVNVDKKKRKKSKSKGKIKIRHLGGRAELPYPDDGKNPRQQSLYDSLRPNNYAAIRPLITNWTQPPVIPDYQREALEQKKREQDALDKWKQEAEEGIHAKRELNLLHEQLWKDRFSRPSPHNEPSIPQSPIDPFYQRQWRGTDTPQEYPYATSVQFFKK
jgi:hypothetical protein